MITPLRNHVIMSAHMTTTAPGSVSSPKQPPLFRHLNQSNESACTCITCGIVSHNGDCAVYHSVKNHLKHVTPAIAPSCNALLKLLAQHRNFRHHYTLIDQETIKLAAGSTGCSTFSLNMLALFRQRDRHLSKELHRYVMTSLRNRSTNSEETVLTVPIAPVISGNQTRKG